MWNYLPMVLEINTPSFTISLFSDGLKLSEFSHRHGETQELDGHSLKGISCWVGKDEDILKATSIANISVWPKNLKDEPGLLNASIDIVCPRRMDFELFIRLLLCVR